MARGGGKSRAHRTRATVHLKGALGACRDGNEAALRYHLNRLAKRRQASMGHLLRQAGVLASELAYLTYGATRVM